LWITTRLATCYRGSIENLHILVFKLKFCIFCMQVQTRSLSNSPETRFLRY